MHLVRAFKVLLMVVLVMKGAAAYLFCKKSLYLLSVEPRKTRVVASIL